MGHLECGSGGMSLEDVVDQGDDHDHGRTLDKRDGRAIEDLGGMADLRLDDEGSGCDGATLTPSVIGMANLALQTPQTADKSLDHVNSNVLPAATPETPMIATSPVRNVEDNPPALGTVRTI